MGELRRRTRDTAGSFRFRGRYGPERRARFAGLDGHARRNDTYVNLSVGEGVRCPIVGLMTHGSEISVQTNPRHLSTGAGPFQPSGLGSTSRGRSCHSPSSRREDEAFAETKAVPTLLTTRRPQATKRSAEAASLRGDYPATTPFRMACQSLSEPNEGVWPETGTSVGGAARHPRPAVEQGGDLRLHPVDLSSRANASRVEHLGAVARTAMSDADCPPEGLCDR
jgi:hypothetical protein